MSSLLADEVRSKLPGAEVIASRLAEIFLVQVIRAQLGRPNESVDLLAATFDPQLRKAIEVIHMRYKEKLSLAQIAQSAGMSRSSLAAHFKEKTQLSSMSYLARWRLLKASEFLKNPRATVSQVAAACGHRSTEGFSRAFKRTFGFSPAKARSK